MKGLDLPAPGESQGLSFCTDEGVVEGFLVRAADMVAAYRNRCPYTGVPLNWAPDRFLSPTETLFSVPCMARCFVSRTASVSLDPAWENHCNGSRSKSPVIGHGSNSCDSAAC